MPSIRNVLPIFASPRVYDQGRFPRYHCAMDDENIAQEGYLTAFGGVINALDPEAADFDFQFNNLRRAVQISGLLTNSEKKKLKAMLQIVRMRRS